jgi:hypothetical protein
MGSKIVDNRKVVDGILSQAQFNTHTWYERNSDGTFNINGSWYGSENIFNWVLTKSVNTKYIKSGVMKITTAKKSAVIKFETTFPDENYFIFFNSTANSNVYWTNKYINRAVINSSFTLGDEVTWFAIHKTLLISSSFNNSGNIFAGTRAIAGTLPDAYDVNGELIDTITISDSSFHNGSKWYRNEYVIVCSKSLDGIQTLPNFKPLVDKNGNNILNAQGEVEYNYSIILSADKNINTYYRQKSANGTKIGVSYPESCSIDYFIVKNGVNWWEQI